jgi:hypothetical protein
MLGKKLKTLPRLLIKKYNASLYVILLLIALLYPGLEINKEIVILFL